MATRVSRGEHSALRASLASVLLLWLGAHPTIAQDPSTATPLVREALVANQRVDRPIHGGEKQYFVFHLASGEFARLVVEQHGANVGLTLRDPEGQTLFEGNSPNGDQATEPLTAVASQGGLHELEIWSLIPRAPLGRYTVLLEEPRQATASERQRFVLRNRAWTLIEGGFDLRAKARDAATLRQAIEQWELAAPLWGQVGDWSQQARALNAAGLAHRQLGELEKARPHYQQSLALWRRAGNRSGEADSLNNLGRLQALSGELSEALQTHLRALAVRREIEDLRGVAQSLSQIGTTQRSLGETDKAHTALSEALSVSQQLGDHRAEPHIHNNLGLISQDRAQHQKAIEQFNLALALFKQAGSQRFQAVTLSNLGTVYQSIGDFARAEALFAEALSLNQELGDRNGIAATQFNLGWTLLKANKARPSLIASRAALEQFGEVDNRQGQGRALVVIGGALLELGELETASARLHDGLTILQDTGALQGQFDAHHLLAKLLDRQGKPVQALAQIDRALQLAQRLDNTSARGTALTEAARIEFNRGQLLAARARLVEALEITESIRSQVASQTHRTTFLARSLDRYELLTDVLMALEGAQPGRGNATAALANVERGRARSLLELLTESEIRGDGDPQLLARERSLRQNVNAKERRRLQLVARGGTDSLNQATALDAEIRRLLEGLVDVRAKLRTENPRHAALLEPRPSTVAEIQGELLDEDTLLLEFALGEQTSYLWAVTHSTLEAYRLPPRARIEELTRRVIAQLQAPRSPPTPTTATTPSNIGEPSNDDAELSRMLLAPLGKRLGQFPRLLIAADGALRSLPFAALPTPTSNKKADYLVAHHEIVYTPSASVLLLQRRATANRVPAPKVLAIFADPVFRADDPRVRGTTATARATTTQSRSAQPPSVEASANVANSFSRLRFSRREAQRLAAMVDEDQRLLALSFDASRKTVTSPEMTQYRNVHFATHGVLDGERPELSGVVLSLVDASGQPQEGFLRLHDIYNLHLNANLVVLSACQTALGQEIRGEGLVSLARGFIYAGASRVVASLWQVPDRASAELMVHFYRGMLQEGLSAAAALRSAQIALIEEGRFADPYSWAAFVLQGDWRRASPPRKQIPSRQHLESVSSPGGHTP